MEEKIVLQQEGALVTDQTPHERRSGVALLLIDVINPLTFRGAEALLPQAVPMARRIAALKQRLRALAIPTIYVNDNFDCWHLGFHELVDRFRHGGPGAPMVEILAPEKGEDFSILKPQHSGFFRTALEVLLERLGTQRLILTGIAGDICVLFTANDAYMRGFEIMVPADCIISERRDDNAHALRQMNRLLKADVRPSDAIQRSDLDVATRLQRTNA